MLTVIVVCISVVFVTTTTTKDHYSRLSQVGTTADGVIFVSALSSLCCRRCMLRVVSTAHTLPPTPYELVIMGVSGAAVLL